MGDNCGFLATKAVNGWTATPGPRVSPSFILMKVSDKQICQRLHLHFVTSYI